MCGGNGVQEEASSKSKIVKEALFELKGDEPAGQDAGEKALKQGSAYFFCKGSDSTQVRLQCP